MSDVVRPNPLVADRPDEAMTGMAPRIVGETYISHLQDFVQLLKPRVTLLVVLTSWAGYFLAARRNGAAFFSLKLLATLAGIGLVSAGAAALNQVWERNADARMSRTKDRPLPAKRMGVGLASACGILLTGVGGGLLAINANLLTAFLAFLTAAAYLLVYTPLKKISPACTFIGAFPGAMPAVLGWTAVTGRLEWESFALFAIVFFWQFPHFLAIAWLYREDYERAGIRMLPVVDQQGRATVRQILIYGLALIPVSLAPFFLQMSGWIYVFGAFLLGVAYLLFGVRLAMLKLPPSSAHTKKYARELLQASIVYLPLLLGLMVVNGVTR